MFLPLTGNRFTALSLFFEFVFRARIDFRYCIVQAGNMSDLTIHEAVAQP